jgi:hypothetical protein
MASIKSVKVSANRSASTLSRSAEEVPIFYSEEHLLLVFYTQIVLIRFSPVASWPVRNSGHVYT